MSVFTQPGHTELTLIRSPASSLANATVSRFSAVLDEL